MPTVMNLDNALGIHAQALNVRAERAKVLASNLANVDTPGFKAQDIDFKKVLQNAQSQFDRGELPSANLTGELKYRVPMQASVDGNTSELGVEQAAFNSNAMDFQASMTFLNSKIKGIKSAIQGR